MRSKKLVWVAVALLVGTLWVSACGATPEPQVIEVEKVVTEVVEKVVTEIVEVAGTPEIKEVQVTQIVEVEKVVTPTPEPPPAEGPKIFRMRLEHDIRTVDPAFHYSDIEEFAASPIFNGLVTYGPNSYDIVNDLAESIESSEDGTEITFKLKEGAQWHKGYGEVTAEDVKFSYERYAAVDSPYKDDWSTLDNVEVIDKYSGIIHLKEAFAPLWRSTMPTPRGWILPKAYIEEVGAEAFGTNPVGSGPYEFVEWKPQEVVLLKRFDDYFGEPGGFDEMHLIPIEENKAAEIAMEAGELDLSYVSHAAADLFEADADFRIERRPTLSYQWVGMNVEHPKLQDINVRQAIRYGIDVPSILQAAYVGQVEQAYSLVPPGLIGHWAEAPRYERDVEKAKEYMAKAGVESLQLRLATVDTSEYRSWAEIIQANLAEIGIDVLIDTIDETTFWGMGADAQKELELTTISYTSFPDPAWYTMWFTCDQIDLWNWMRWCNEEFDELHKQGMVTMDDAQRQEIYEKMQMLWDEAAHTVWITNNARVVVFTPDIVPALTPHGQVQTRWMMPAQ